MGGRYGVRREVFFINFSQNSKDTVNNKNMNHVKERGEEGEKTTPTQYELNVVTLTKTNRVRSCSVFRNYEPS
jgi:autotransporter adhesin